MTSKLDLGRVIAIVSAVAVMGAIIAGVAAVGGPGAARDQRFDDARYEAMGAVASAAQCAYATTGALPADLAGVRAAARAMPADRGDCAESWLTGDIDAMISYEVAAPDQINLCAEFRRPSLNRARRGRGLDLFARRFPELDAPRSEIGRRCYLIRLRGTSAPH